MTNAQTTIIDMRYRREIAPMNGHTDFTMFQVRDRIARLADEARSERLAAELEPTTVRMRLGVALLRLGRTLAPEAPASEPRHGEPAPFPRVERANDRIDLRPAA